MLKLTLRPTPIGVTFEDVFYAYETFILTGSDL